MATSTPNAGSDSKHGRFRRGKRPGRRDRRARRLLGRGGHAIAGVHEGAGEAALNAGSIVQFENVGLRYGTGAETLSDLSFSLREGGFYFLTGPSGAGKTSLLKLLYLALRPSRGLIRLFGEDIVTTPPCRPPPRLRPGPSLLARPPARRGRELHRGDA